MNLELVRDRRFELFGKYLERNSPTEGGDTLKGWPIQGRPTWTHDTLGKPNPIWQMNMAVTDVIRTWIRTSQRSLQRRCTSVNETTGEKIIE